MQKHRLLILQANPTVDNLAALREYINTRGTVLGLYEFNTEPGIAKLIITGQKPTLIGQWRTFGLNEAYNVMKAIALNTGMEMI